MGLNVFITTYDQRRTKIRVKSRVLKGGLVKTVRADCVIMTSTSCRFNTNIRVPFFYTHSRQVSSAVKTLGFVID